MKTVSWTQFLDLSATKTAAFMIYTLGKLARGFGAHCWGGGTRRMYGFANVRAE